MVDRAELTYHFLINFLNFTLPSKDSIRPPSVRIAAVLPTKPGNPQHLNGIKRFRKNIKLNIAKIDEFNETAIHFNLNGHFLNEHFRFYILKDKLHESIRKSTETDLINLFVKLSFPILNKKINNA
jgi:hypothetical protein